MIGGKFRLGRQIGAGGMGAVYAAVNVNTGKQLALKWLVPSDLHDESGTERFVREAQAAARIQHPHVVDVYDVGTHGEGHFLVMELLRGEPLSAWIARGAVPYATLLPIIVPAVRAIGAAHRHGVVHRDLKPDNVFVCTNEDGSVWGPKVLDFGISKIIDEVAPSLTQSGTTLGTPYYMSPEQVRSLRHVDARTDVYALGVILYECLTGRVPFAGESYGAIAIEIATGSLVPPSEHAPDIPAALDDIVLRAMARSVDARFQSADALANALAEIIDGRVSRAPRPVARPQQDTSGAEGARAPALASGAHDELTLPVRNDRATTIGALLFVLVAAAAAAYALTRPDEGELVAPAAPDAPPPTDTPSETAVMPTPTAPAPSASPVTTPTPSVDAPPATEPSGRGGIRRPPSIARPMATPSAPAMAVTPQPAPEPAPTQRVDPPAPRPEAPSMAPSRRTGNLSLEDFDP